MRQTVSNNARNGKPARRVLFYSHDTFGLGHLRRSRALAAALMDGDEDASAIILTGSPVAGRFTFPKGVDHIRLPGVTKLADGSYVAQTLGLDIDEVTSLRAGLIRTAIEEYTPDLLIVDKEPTGFRGELLPSLDWLRENGTTKVVLGLRDVLDEPEVLAAEWERKGAVEATEKYYDEIWVYGMRDVYDPTKGLPLSQAAHDRMHWTGYLRREAPDETPPAEEPYVLITPGGGGDGAAMVSLVLDAYEQDPDLTPKAKLIYGLALIAGSNSFMSGLRAWFAWAATTPSARCFLLTNAPSSCRAPCPGWNNGSVPAAPKSWGLSACWKKPVMA